MLSSWKEIAHFFGKGVRTVQRWEKTLGLPIHRPAGAPSNVVLARTKDLEEWMHRGLIPAADSSVVPDAAVMDSIGQLERELATLASEMGGKTAFVNGVSTAPQRLVAITATIASLTRVANEKTDALHM